PGVLPRSHVSAGRACHSRRLMSVLIVAALGAAASACRQAPGGEPARRYGLGRPATPPEIAARDVDVGPDGVGLPPGSGTVVQGRPSDARQCAACHGQHGEGTPVNPRLIGRDPAAEGFNFAKNPNLQKTIGNYWPYATTLFDYVRRAMPQTAPGSLTNDEVY